MKINAREHFSILDLFHVQNMGTYLFYVSNGTIQIFSKLYCYMIWTLSTLKPFKLIR
jgi:hypothetical protein